jgi:peptidoglycan hydrolase-like protein with peptidoglycan-binding domain
MVCQTILERKKAMKIYKTSIVLLGILTLLLAACSTSPSPPDLRAESVVDALPQPGTLTSPAEGYAQYDDEPYGCGEDAALKPGPESFKNYLAQFGIDATTYTTGCRKSFHQVGQALDLWSSEKQAIADWLTANGGEMANRLGIVQVVWNERMWRSYHKAGEPVGDWGSGSGHTDHIHISFGSAGAQGLTSFFTEVIQGVTPPTPEPVPPPAPTPPPASGGWPMLGLGGDSSLTTLFQYLFNANGANLVVDGDFGPQTEMAVKYVQGLNGWAQTGVVDEAMWRSVIANFSLQQGSQGLAVKALQQRLTDKGYPLDVDGDFGTVTAGVVTQFQQDLGLYVDAMVGPQTWQALLN